MEEVTNARLICIGCDDHFQMKWIRKIIDTNPSFDGDKLSFVIIGSNSRIEISTMDFNRLENVAKRITAQKVGRQFLPIRLISILKKLVAVRS
jgi:hypothetical protein